MNYFVNPPGASGDQGFGAIGLVDVERAFHELCENPAHSIAAVVLLIVGTTSDTPENHELIDRFISRFSVELSFVDAMRVARAVNTNRDASLAAGIPAPTSEDLAKSMMAILHACAGKAFGTGRMQ